MKASPYRNGKYWRVIVPARLNDNGKSRPRYFKTEEEANAAIQELEAEELSDRVQTDYTLVILEIIEKRMLDIQSLKLQLNGDVVIEFQPYCAVICESCKEIVIWEAP